MRLILAVEKLERQAAGAEAAREAERKVVGVCWDGAPRIDRSTLAEGQSVALDIMLICRCDAAVGVPPVFEFRDSERVTTDPKDYGVVMFDPEFAGMEPYEVGKVVAQEFTRVGSAVVTVAYRASLTERNAAIWGIPAGGLPGLPRCEGCGALVFSPRLHECSTTGFRAPHPL
jgi:hypothetical protein